MSDTIPGDARLGTVTKRHPMAYHTALTFRQAADHVIPFGRYRGQTIDQIAKKDVGLLWLQSLYDDRLKQREDLMRTPGPWERETNGCLHTYLTDSIIAREVIDARKKG